MFSRTIIEAFRAALGHKRVGFGAYSFGKAQRAVSLIREMGDQSPDRAWTGALSVLTRHLLGDDAGDIGNLDADHCDLCITSPWSLNNLPPDMKKFVLTGQHYYDHPCICISDHIDFNGLSRMVDKLDPQFVVVYHPEVGNSQNFSRFLLKKGRESCTLPELSADRQTTL